MGSFVLLVLLEMGAWMLVVGYTPAIVRRSNHWSTVFAFPLVWAALDTLISAFSPHGTFGSLAYAQMDLLPLVQFASLAGTPGWFSSSASSPPSSRSLSIGENRAAGRSSLTDCRPSFGWRSCFWRDAPNESPNRGRDDADRPGRDRRFHRAENSAHASRSDLAGLRGIVEQHSRPSPGASVIARVPVGPAKATPYARYGDWFGWMRVVLAVVMRISPVVRQIAPGGTAHRCRVSAGRRSQALTVGNADNFRR